MGTYRLSSVWWRRRPTSKPSTVRVGKPILNTMHPRPNFHPSWAVAHVVSIVQPSTLQSDMSCPRQHSSSHVHVACGMPFRSDSKLPSIMYLQTTGLCTWL
eukprot:963134-Amorphochlora_amoeboformis.AAC.1